MDLDTTLTPTQKSFPNTAERKVQKQLYRSGLTQREESHQNPEMMEEEREGELKKTAKLKGWRRGEARRDVRHAEDKFLEPLQGIWSYGCQLNGSRERRERDLNSGREKKRGKHNGRDSLGGRI